MSGDAAAELRDRLAGELPKGLLDHIDRVVKITDALAERHHLDTALARLMAQAHDVARALPPAELLARAENAALPVDPVEHAEPVLLHGPVGAHELRGRFGVDDARVLHAVYWHTSGHPDYTPEAWAMFVADKIDPHKVERWPALSRVATLAERSLEAAALTYLEMMLERALEERWFIHPAAVLARNALVARNGAHST
jgi:predicted HD superfamily hydrolase involved in NAD metabolism